MGNLQHAVRLAVAAVLSYGLWGAQSAVARTAKVKASAAQLAAQRSLQQGISALINRDFAAASQALTASFQKWPRPQMLYYLGALAQAEGRTLNHRA